MTDSSMVVSLLAALAVSLLVVVGGAVALAAWLGREPKVRSSGDLRMHRLADGVWMYRGFFSNSAVLVAPEGVVVVDTQVAPEAARRLRAEIERVTRAPIRFVVNTHYHGDHTGGNGSFPEAEIVATADTARYVVERDAERVEYARTFGLEFQQVHPTVGPTRTFVGRTSLRVGAEELHVMHLGRVETPDACVVHWPARGVVACGDGVATHDYPYLGVPFMDEGLRDDGSWIGFLEAVRALRPKILIPGHGPAIVGEEAVAARLDLLITLFRDLLTTTKAELARADGDVPRVVAAVEGKLAHYPRRDDLREHTVSQRFAVWRCINNLDPARKGQGWWHDLRPSAIRRAPPETLGPPATDSRETVRVALRASRRHRPRAVALLERWLTLHPQDAAAHAALSDVLFDGLLDARREGRPFVDAMEYVAASSKAAKAALAIDPAAPLALLNLGAAEVFGGMVLAQCMSGAIAKLERALAAPGLDARQRRKAQFFLGKAHWTEQREAEADRWLRALLPAPTRPLFPLLRARLRAYP